MLKTDVLERVSREIWLEADEGIDYAPLAEQLQTLLPVELVKAAADEEDAVGDLNQAVEALADLLFSIADALDRHHSNEDYLKLYEDQMKLFGKFRHRNKAIQSYNRWCEKDCLGSPTIEDLEEYRSVRLMKLFRTGIYKERVSTMTRGKHYDNEVAFQVPEDDKVLSQKDVHKHYYCLRKMCEYEDHQLKVVPLQVGIYFYTHRKDENAKEHRKAFLKYMTKVEMAQQQMMEMRKAFPGYTFEEQKLGTNPDKKTHGKLTYDVIQEFIENCETDEAAKNAILKEYETVKAISKTQRAAYAYVKKWFLGKYGKEFEAFHEKQKAKKINANDKN